MSLREDQDDYPLLTINRLVPRTDVTSTGDKYEYKPGPRQAIAEIPEQKFDAVNHPEHYKLGGIETIDFIEAKRLNYNKGNAVKYITRAGIKNEKVVEDLQKAIWYLNREIECIEREVRKT